MSAGEDIGNPPYSSLIMDGFFSAGVEARVSDCPLVDDVAEMFGVPVMALLDTAASNMPTMRCGKLCSQDDTGMWHIWPQRGL